MHAAFTHHLAHRPSWTGNGLSPPGARQLRFQVQQRRHHAVQPSGKKGFRSLTAFPLVETRKVPEAAVTTVCSSRLCNGGALYAPSSGLIEVEQRK
ncbi:hypothetical protein J1614_003588 [Plenodomus biglobosus]|nr:hypothetical protein J1614_003588 [Plenodomus biglobosus]